MTFLAIKLFIGDVFAFLAKHRWAFTILLCGIVAVGGAVFLKGCYVDHEINKTQNEVTNTRIEEANKDAVTKSADAEVQRTTKDTHSAANERQQAIKRDSNQYQNTNAGQRFCERFPDDSTCK